MDEGSTTNRILGLYHALIVRAPMIPTISLPIIMPVFSIFQLLALPRYRPIRFQRQNKIRQMFLEHFGNRFTQRAEYFSAIFSKGGPGERAEITTHQLRRYLGSCGTPAKAKVSELTLFPLGIYEREG